MKKSTKATSISKETKKKVWERDKHRCIYCGRQVPVEYACSHFIKRSHLGLGIEQNIVTACPDCHYKYDFSNNYRKMYKYTWDYLLKQYGALNKENLVYHKYSRDNNL